MFQRSDWFAGQEDIGTVMFKTKKNNMAISVYYWSQTGLVIYVMCLITAQYSSDDVCGDQWCVMDPVLIGCYLSLSEPALAFTHSPGCMFVTDKEDSTTSLLTVKASECPVTFGISQNPLHFSMASKATVQQIRQLEEIAVEDPGRHACCLTGNNGIDLLPSSLETVLTHFLEAVGWPISSLF